MKINLYKAILTLIILIFIMTLILATTGFYQSELKEKTILTDEAIKKFESDIKNGKEIDVQNYLDLNKKNYDNIFSKSGRFISKKINKIISKGIEKTLKIIIKSIEE